MGFFDNLLGGGDDKKKKDDSSNKPSGMVNPFQNLGKKKFQGSGQSLGGNSKPGKVVQVELPNPGPLGVKVEKRPNSEGTAIVALVVEGSQAEAAGLKVGDILCFSGSDGQEEITYDMFLELAKAGQRPLHFDIRRFELKTEAKAVSTSGEAYNRKQAMIAAADAREKAHKAKTKPVRAVTKTTLQRERQKEELRKQKEQQQQEESNTAESEHAKEARQAAKRDEAALAAQLGYNPYEPARATAGQARNATTTTQHGAFQADHADDAVPPSNNNPTTSAASSAEDLLEQTSPEFKEAYTTTVSTTIDAAQVKTSFGICRKLVANATSPTKGQNMQDEEAASKFRRVRLANPKIKQVIVDVQGAVEIMMTFGFELVEQDGESLLVYPQGYGGPEWLAAALQQMEQYENSK